MSPALKGWSPAGQAGSGCIPVSHYQKKKVNPRSWEEKQITRNRATNWHQIFNINTWRQKKWMEQKSEKFSFLKMLGKPVFWSRILHDTHSIIKRRYSNRQDLKYTSYGFFLKVLHKIKKEILDTRTLGSSLCSQDFQEKTRTHYWGKI